MRKIRQTEKLVRKAKGVAENNCQKTITKDIKRLKLSDNMTSFRRTGPAKKWEMEYNRMNIFIRFPKFTNPPICSIDEISS